MECVKLFATSAVSMRERRANPPRSLAAHGRATPCTSRRAAARPRADGVAWAHPKWAEAHGPMPAARPLLLFCGAGCRPVPAPPRGSLLKSLRAAARSPRRLKNKKARVLADPGPVGGQVAGSAYIALPPPGKVGSSWPARTGLTAAQARPSRPMKACWLNALRGYVIAVPVLVFTKIGCPLA